MRFEYSVKVIKESLSLSIRLKMCTRSSLFGFSFIKKQNSVKKEIKSVKLILMLTQFLELVFPYFFLNRISVK